ncbi:heavy-metal-associated domain-containing protein [Corynebacterium vitaeruminis]|uniref:HMA domain-containing protein n=1 Tax=Corynebacterium vitaeruminis DSM 20294 TaxID=1224164 RepID=W5Y3N6_9CORY|nr:heavy-metal-associated domain-containing protein [Corynebacterium vitaeruminis]AHI23460.1 hypothetical protein B843_10400 [Corynebacterium vitaeruminis DSM 20294]
MSTDSTFDSRVFDVTGMTCGHCKAAVEEEVGAVKGVNLVVATPATGKVVVEGTNINEAEVRAALAEAGYQVV